MTKDKAMTRYEYLRRMAILNGAPWWLAHEAVATTAMEHPEWDMDEKKTWREWNDH